jgi:hypothetical protein
VSVITRPMVWVMDGKVKYRMTGIRAHGIQSTMLSFQSFELGPPTPSTPPPAGSVVFPLWIQEGRHTRLRGREWGDPIPTKGQTLWYSVHSIIPLRIRVSRINTLNKDTDLVD